LEARLSTLQALNQANIKTYAFIGPILPELLFSINEFELLLQQLKSNGVRELYLEIINLSTMKSQILEALKSSNIDINKFLQIMQDKEYLQEYKRQLEALTLKHQFKLKLNQVLEHQGAKNVKP
jgi:DNA repair photolyase